MRTITPTFGQQLSRGFVMYQRIQILLNGAIVVSSDELPLNTPPLNVVGGSLQVDATASFRRHLSGLKIADNTGFWTPSVAQDLFSVTSGAEIFVQAGQVVNGLPEVFDQGYFGMQGADIQDSKDGLVITLDAYDRARKISRNKFTVPYVIRPNWNTVNTVVGMWSDRLPGIQFTVTPSNHITTFQVIDEQADPWEEGRKLLEAMGYEGFFAANGRCVIRPIPNPNDPAGQITWEYAEGTEGATMLRVGRQQDNQDIFNGQIVIGASTYGLTPARAEVWDDDPQSPTYYLGPYGKVPNFTQSDKVSYNAQATDMAKGLLNKSKGTAEAVSFDIIPNHAHEEGDIVIVTRAKSKLSSVKLVIDQMNVPLTAASNPVMSITCRKRTI